MLKKVLNKKKIVIKISNERLERANRDILDV